MNVHQDCIIEFLSLNGFEPMHIDAWTESVVIYQFGIGLPQLRFERACIPMEATKNMLKNFLLDHRVNELMRDECACNWA